MMVPACLCATVVAAACLLLPRPVAGFNPSSKNVPVKRKRPVTVLAASFASANNDIVPPTYPASRRALLDAARSVEGGKRGTYTAVGWSNRAGSVITPASVPGVYEASRPFLWNKIDVGCKMTVVQLSSTVADVETGVERPELFVHSPVALDARLADALDDLGVVRHVVSPNYEHVKYASQWADRYPDANMWGCPGISEKEPQVRWTGEIPYGCRPPGYPSVDGEGSTPPEPTVGMWDWGEVQPLHFNTEVNPFTGKAFFNEVVFYHSPSGTLLCTDTYWNYPSPDGVTNAEYDGVKGKEEDYGPWELAPEVGKIPLGSSLWKVGMDKLFRPFYMNLMVKPDARKQFRDLASYVAGDGWNVRTVVPAHGDTIRGSTLCRNVLRRHFNLE